MKKLRGRGLLRGKKTTERRSMRKEEKKLGKMRRKKIIS